MVVNQGFRHYIQTKQQKQERPWSFVKAARASDEALIGVENQKAWVTLYRPTPPITTGIMVSLPPTPDLTSGRLGALHTPHVSRRGILASLHTPQGFRRGTLNVISLE